MYHCGFSYNEVQSLPVTYKRWFIDRLVKEINKSPDEGGGQTKAANTNTPDMRSMMGKQRAQVPAKLRRFT